MNKKKIIPFISDHVIISKIYYIRGEKVMLDKDLAEMYEVPTKVLKQAVRRNIDIFPKQFMFEMTSNELKNWRSQFVTSNSDKMGLRYNPFCFTEHGILQLANVLKSKSARKMSIRIIEVFVKMTKMLSTHKDILLKLEKLEKKLMRHDERSNKYEQEIRMLFEAISQLIAPSNEPRKRIGYKQHSEE